MKIICDCGNVLVFNTIDEETGLETEYQDDDMYGQYATKDGGFSLWSEHDVAGVECSKCKKAIWYFT